MKKKTTILIVDQTGKENRLVQIPNQLLLHWKKYFVAFVILAISLIGILGVTIYQKTSDHYKEQLAEANRVKRMINIKKVKESFESIDKSVFEINKFLEERGLHNFKIDHAGGPKESISFSDLDEISGYYDSKIKEIEVALNNTPLGAPSKGNITSTFGYRSNPFGGYSSEKHSGIDFRGNIGDPVTAPADGTVTFAGVRGGYGNCIIIKHNNEIETLYGHLSKINVKEGQQVKHDQIIGKIGNTGRSTGPHLHYEVHKKGEKINPIQYVKPFK